MQKIKRYNESLEKDYNQLQEAHCRAQNVCHELASKNYKLENYIKVLERALDIAVGWTVRYSEASQFINQAKEELENEQAN